MEFYKTFWDSLVEGFNESFVKGTMGPSQRQAVITLIEKKRPRWLWSKTCRPISLYDVDAKIASKVIAERMKRLLPEFIIINQDISQAEALAEIYA